MKKAEPQYLVQIQFKGQEGQLIRVWDISEEVASLDVANGFRTMIDNTVSKARVVDIAANEVIEVWK